MSEQITKVPAIRFKGFTDPWEQSKLKEISIKVTEKNKLGDYTETLTNSAEFGIINQRDFFDKDISNIKNLNGYYIVKNDDFVYNPRISNFAPVGPIKRNKLNKTGVMSPLYYVFRTHDVDKTYLEKYFETFYWHRFMELNGDSGARADRFAIKDSILVEMPIPFPLEQEQKQVGLFFEQLDNLITLHQRELDLMKKQKKTLLSKMFPKTGEQYPEIRFKGFTDPWEQCKFVDLLDKKDGIRRGPFGSSLKKDFFIPESDYVVYEQQNAIYDRFDTRYNITKEKFNELRRFKLVPSDFIMSGAGTIGRISKVPEGIKQGVFNQALIRFRINDEVTDSDYFLQWVRSDNIQRQFTEANPGSAMTNLVPMSEVKEWDIIVPSKAEQYQLGKFFSNLDTTITLQQRKLDQMKIMKKSLLKAMFV